MDAPLARALLGRRLDDAVAVELAAGPVTYTIVAIDYPTDEPATRP
jgi:transcription elongation GreA/GreB family factor